MRERCLPVPIQASSKLQSISVENMEWEVNDLIYLKYNLEHEDRMS